MSIKPTLFPHDAARTVALGMLSQRLSLPGLRFLQDTTEEISCGITALRFAELISLASRYARRSEALAPRPHEREAALSAVAGWNPERWNILETLRAAIVLSHPDMATDSFSVTFEQCLRFGDEGELCALYKVLPLLPRGERFVWRAGEACRSNMRSVVEAVACDSPYPVAHFDEIAWRQLVIKAVFVDLPLWRVAGLDTRLSPELARMALDLADERRSAGRPIPPQLWLCLGRHPGDRGLKALKYELTHGTSVSQRAVLLALARATELPRAQDWLHAQSRQELESTFAQARAGDFGQDAFGRLCTTP